MSEALPQEMTSNYICDVLGITYTELEAQPSWWVHRQLTLLAAKSKVEAQKMKDTSKKNA